MIQSRTPDFHRQVLAVNRVERLLRKVTGALDGAGVPYAVVGGNAVAAWVATVDDGAVRATKDVDILLRRGDLTAAAEALEPVGLEPHEVLGVPMFLDKKKPNPRTGVHVVSAEEKVYPTDMLPAPGVSSAVRSRAGYLVLDLHRLLVMKLVAYRDIDRVHVRDLLSVGLISQKMVDGLPEMLRRRFEQIRAAE